MAELKIDFKKLKENVLKIKQKLNGKKLCAVVKSNAYGLGAVKVCKTICDYVDYFAVNNLQEAKRILKFEKPIIILMPTNKILKSCNIHYVIDSVINAQKIEQFAKKNNMCANVHLKINSGMNRLGADIIEAKKICNIIEKSNNLKLCGICTHNMESFGKLHKSQQEKFKNILLELNLPFDVLVHSESSESVLKNQFVFGDIVRCGIAIYGGLEGMQNVVSFCGNVIAIQNLKIGERASYGGDFIAKKETRIAIIDLGYNNGIRRSFSKNGCLFFNDKKFKIIGRICMNMLAVNVKNENIKIGDKFEFIGKNQSIIEIAKKYKTISYEVLTNLKK